MLNKILKLSLVVVLLLFSILLFKYLSKKEEKWEFVGYQYRWNEDYVNNTDLKSEKDCIDYGERWLKKQTSQDVLFTCSSDCESYSGILEVCKHVCEYGKVGLIKCRE